MTLKINGATGGSVSLDAPDNTSPAGTDVTLTLPVNDGDAGQYLQTDGTGVLSWQTVASDSISEGNTSVECVDSGSDGHITFDTEGIERARINNVGDIFFNKTGAANGSTTDVLTIDNNNSNSNDNLTTAIAFKRTGNSSSIIYSRIGSVRTGTHNTDLAFSVNDGGALAEEMRLTSTGNLQFNSGYGSVATAYGVRAWASWRGDISSGGNSQLNGAGNVSSVTDNGAGDYTINFTNAMPDDQYVVAGNCIEDTTGGRGDNFFTMFRSGRATGSVRVNTVNTAGTPIDNDFVFAAVIR